MACKYYYRTVRDLKTNKISKRVLVIDSFCVQDPTIVGKDEVLIDYKEITPEEATKLTGAEYIQE